MVEHVEQDILALAALGEPVDGDGDRRHLATCGECSAEIASLAEVVSAGRTMTEPALLVAPSAVVWGRIRAELDLSAGLDPEGGRTELEPTGTDDQAAALALLAAEPEDESGRAPDHLAPVIPLRARRAPWIATAAAAGLVLGGVGGAWWATSGNGDPAAPAIVAQATLEPLPGWSAAGTASVELATDGSRELVVTVDGDPRAGDYREVWLLDPEVTQLVSLGILQGSEGRFTLPEGLDLVGLPVVDVSEEPLDGNPQHSGDSVVRGVLGA